MCGIIALMLANRDAAVNQELYDGLSVLQHRGQDAAGMVVGDKFKRMHTHKDCGLVRDVFKLHHVIKLVGFYGIAHCRYPTAGTSSNVHEAQPFITNIPFGLCIAHNGNLTNTFELQKELSHRHHFNTDSDSELMLSLLADELLQMPAAQSRSVAEEERQVLGPDNIFAAVRGLMARARGGYACVLMVAGHGIMAFRDPFGIRPLCFGKRQAALANTWDYAAASESVALESLGYTLERDVRPGEAVWFDLRGNLQTMQCHDSPKLSPCLFEWIYFCRPDSVLDGVSVYRARQLMGSFLADKIRKERDLSEIDVICPVPDTSRISALQCALQLGLPHEEGLTKNRYIARTFIMPGQENRRQSVRKKLNPVADVFKNKRVMLVDDSVVRGTTSSQIIEMCRDQGALKVYFCSASPPVRYPNVYGIDMPSVRELVAHERNDEEIARELGADWVVFSDLDDMQRSVMDLDTESPTIQQLDCSCFDGKYVTGDVGADYFEKLARDRSDAALAIGRSITVEDLERLSFIHSPSLSPMRGGRKVPQPKAWQEREANTPEDQHPLATTLDPAPGVRISLEAAIQRQRRTSKHFSNDDYQKLQNKFSGWT